VYTHVLANTVDYQGRLQELAFIQNSFDNLEHPIDMAIEKVKLHSAVVNLALLKNLRLLLNATPPL
jgi:hypothetical protein